MKTKKEEEVPMEEKVSLVQSILGNAYTPEKIEHYLLGADGDIQIALNHILATEANDTNPQPKSDQDQSIESMEKVLSDLAEELKCSLCLEYFTSPVALNCLHTFCTECVQPLIHSEDRTVQCPLCRVQSPVSHQPGGGLKPNHYLANIVEKLKTAKKSKLCGECRTEICAVYCYECKVFLCSGCNDKIHTMRLLTSHHRKPFEDCFFHPASTPLADHSVSEEVAWGLDYVLPFNIKADMCRDIFYQWLRELWFAPFDLERTVVLREFRAVYVPYWQFELEPHKGTSGSASASPSHILVCGNASSPECGLVQNLEPWNFNHLEPFFRKHVEQRQVELRPFTLDADAAWKRLGRDKLDRLNDQSNQRKVRTMSPSSKLTESLDTSAFGKKRCRRLYVPVYSTTFEYQGKPYRFVINGCDPSKVYGQRPYSPGKVAASLSFTGLGAVLFSRRINTP